MIKQQEWICNYILTNDINESEEYKNDMIRLIKECLTMRAEVDESTYKVTIEEIKVDNIPKLKIEVGCYGVEKNNRG